MNKGAIINFEWLRDCNYYEEDEFKNLKLQLIEKEIQKASKDGCNVIVGIYLMDGFLPYSKEQFSSEMRAIQDILEKYNIKKILIISGHGETIGDIGLPYCYFDYTLRMTYNGYRDIFSEIPKYESKKNKNFLLLGGNSARPNRIGLFSKFYEEKMFNRGVWTFFPPDTANDEKYCRNYLSHWSDTQYREFLDFCRRSLDDKYSNASCYMGDQTNQKEKKIFYDLVNEEWTKNMVYLDPLIFSETSFSVITEGPNHWRDNHYFVTEKTWRTILHQHPFILVGHPEQLLYLENLGFKTFLNYMKVPDYARIHSDEEKFQAVVENTKHFLDIQDEFNDQIKRDVIHNYNLLLEKIKDQEIFFNFLKTEYYVSTEDIEYYLDRKGYDQLIRNPANGI
jgi:hypothetical protein